MPDTGPSYQLYNDPWEYYNMILEDIRKAKTYVYIEIYRFGSGNIGERFRNVLTQIAKKGVEVKILIDSWGTAVSTSYFNEMIKHGGEVRFFQKIKFFIDFFTKNHRRNHRKMVMIDDRITYIGSANITGHSLNWRESVLRMESPITKTFKKIFQEDFNNYNRYVFKKPYLTRIIKSHGFEILRDVPSITRQRIKKRYEWLIRNARQNVFIETPYFLPGFLLRKTMIAAAKRGVSVNIITPKHSDIGLVDVIRNRYLGQLFRNNINIWYYYRCNLHSKIVFIDKEIFCIGSSNFDYRSFRYQHEIILQGTEKSISTQIDHHINESLRYSEPFDYEDWKKRPFIQKFIEFIFIPFRHLF